MRALVLEDQRLASDDLKMLSGISWSLVQRILTEDLAMTRVAVMFMPWILKDQQKERMVKS